MNTAIVGSNGVINRVSEDGVLPDWFRHPHRKYGTSNRIITIIALLQIIPIVASGGDVTYLGNLYAFGVIWSFTLKGVAVLVLRYTHKQDRQYRVPLNFTVRGVEIPLGLGLITLTLFSIAIVNLFTKPKATIAGSIFSVVLFVIFEISEKMIQRKAGGAAHVELDQFNLETESELTPTSVGARPGNILVPVSTYYALYHLDAILKQVRRDQDIVVIHIRMLRRAASANMTSLPTSFSAPSSSCC